ncbi:MAG: NAD-dependent epimerase/dehydratase family protein [Anaerolineaceae bacterium]|nr:NAD-dependent epimerase/dehydratase family protein [Anaerolineaceae bacterium]
MKILFFGGTQFVGRHMVAAALAIGHEVTLFNRGKTNADLFPETEKIIGDRDQENGLDGLKNRKWDVVIDVNCYIPRWIKASANFLKDAVNQYIFVSTGSVYDFQKLGRNTNESGSLLVLEDESTEEWNGPAYGGLKVLCENAAENILPGKVLILRLGVVAGPFDPTDRVTYYVQRVAQGGEVLIPARPDWHVQFIDARDLANYTMLAIEKNLTGIYNTIGNSITWQHFLDQCIAASGSDAKFIFLDDSKFISENVDMAAKPFGTIPLAIPAELAHLRTFNNDKALGEGLLFRSALNTARDVLKWEKTRSDQEERQAGFSLEEEKELLLKWAKREK